MAATLSTPASFVSLPHCWWALQFSGDLDIASGPRLDARLRRAMASHDGDGLVLDLSDVPFMDCAGLGPLLRARNALSERFCLTEPGPRVRRLLALAGVTQTLRILPGTDRWPAEADPRRCHVFLDDLLDHRSTPLARVASAAPEARLPTAVG